MRSVWSYWGDCMTTVARYNGTIVGLTNTTWQAESIVRDRAATEGQLADAAGSGGDSYTKAEIDQKLVDVATGGGVDLGAYATVSYVDTSLDSKVDESDIGVISNSDIDEILFGA